MSSTDKCHDQLSQFGARREAANKSIFEELGEDELVEALDAEDSVLRRLEHAMDS